MMPSIDLEKLDFSSLHQGMLFCECLEQLDLGIGHLIKQSSVVHDDYSPTGRTHEDIEGFDYKGVHTLRKLKDILEEMGMEFGCVSITSSDTSYFNRTYSHQNLE